MKPAPGLLRQILCRIIYHPDERLEPVAIDQPITDGEALHIAGGIDAVHVPGHYAGQVILLWRPGRMLFPADVFMNVTGLGDPLGLGTCKAATHCRNDSRLLLRTGNLLSLARLVSRPFPCVHAAVALPFELFLTEPTLGL